MPDDHTENTDPHTGRPDDERESSASDNRPDHGDADKLPQPDKTQTGGPATDGDATDGADDAGGGGTDAQPPGGAEDGVSGEIVPYSTQRSERHATDEEAPTDPDTKRPDPWAHLRKYQYKPGQSGNPNGRPPKSRSIRERLKQLMRADASQFHWAKEIMEALVGTRESNKDDIRKTIDALDVGDVMMLVAVFEASKGSASHARLLFERLDGKVTGSFNDHRNIEEIEELDYKEERKRAIDFYRGIIEDTEATHKEKLDARRELDKILGLTIEQDHSDPMSRGQQIMDAVQKMKQLSSGENE